MTKSITVTMSKVVNSKAIEHIAFGIILAVIIWLVADLFLAIAATICMAFLVNLTVGITVLFFYSCLVCIGLSAYLDRNK